MRSIKGLKALAIFGSLICALPVVAQNATTSSNPLLLAAKSEATEAAPAAVAASANLSAAVAAYKSRPDAASWAPVWKELRDYLSSGPVIHASAGAILRANPALGEIGAKAVDAGYGARIWAFPKVAEAQTVLLQYQVAAGAPKTKVIGKGRHRKVVVEPPAMVTRFNAVGVPGNVNFRDGQIVKSIPRAVKSDIRDLVLVGTDKTSGAMWVGAYRLSEAGASEDANALASLPSSLMQSGGTPGFAGPDLAINMGGGGGPQSSGYKIVLKFVDGKFTMEGFGADQGPSMVVMQFAQSLQSGRIDVARAWLSDPKLISIPKYAGLLGRAADKPFRVIAMSAPLLNGARFRLMTFDKNDLIVDVGKVKNQWTIKALYIAPPDPTVQKLVGAAPSSAGPEI